MEFNLTQSVSINGGYGSKVMLLDAYLFLNAVESYYLIVIVRRCGGGNQVLVLPASY